MRDRQEIIEIEDNNFLLRDNEGAELFLDELGVARPQPLLLGLLKAYCIQLFRGALVCPS
jgi:hypothetical protein